MCVNSTDPTCIVPLALASTKLPPVAYDEEAYNKSAAREMTIVVSVSRWEQCYLSEWLEYHFALGVTRVYLLPVFGYPLINHPPPGTRLDPLVVQSVKKDDVMRNFTWNDLRVHVLCEVGGHPGDCKDPAAISYAEGGRQHQAKLLVEEIAPRHAGGWISVIDLDEYLTVPNAARTLPGVLESYNRRRATYVTINTLTYGANQVEINPACAQLGMFRTAAEVTCPENAHTKTLFRARAGLHDHSATGPGRIATAHYLVQYPKPEESYSGHGITMALQDASVPCAFEREARCNSDGKMISPERLPWLQLRHFSTRSRAEWNERVRIYNIDYHTTIKSYAPKMMQARYLKMDAPASSSEAHLCKRERVRCRPLRAWPAACPNVSLAGYHATPVPDPPMLGEAAAAAGSVAAAPAEDDALKLSVEALQKRVESLETALAAASRVLGAKGPGRVM